ncbi:MAG: hypothetical protein Q8O67_07670 [Deltaproteobacteria bacterium]|nr:hypothetical protein [Deltaproteobacteria bacterium]
MHLITIALLLTTTSASPAAAGASSRADLAALLEQVRHESFPELAGLQPSTGTLTSSSVFFQSNFDVVAAAGGTLSLSIDFNELILVDPPSPEALRAVLAHELAHSLDYQQRFAASGPAALLGLLPMLFWAPVEEEVERRTDVVAVARGFGPGLLSYRVWLYAHVDADAVKDKRRVYYSPLELALLTTLFERCPQVVPAAIARPPTTARAIVALGPGCF